MSATDESRPRQASALDHDVERAGVHDDRGHDRRSVDDYHLDDRRPINDDRDDRPGHDRWDDDRSGERRPVERGDDRRVIDDRADGRAGGRPDRDSRGGARDGGLVDRHSDGGGERRGARGADRVGGTDGRPTALIGEERAREFQRRWTELKGDFVEEPQHAVHRADDLVGDVLDELEALVRAHRGELGHGLDKDHTTTEDLRIALSRYRGFFERLLSF